MRKNKTLIEIRTEGLRALRLMGNNSDRRRNMRFGRSARQLVRDPLTHFLIIGFVLFSVITALSPQKNDTLITVDDAAILTHIQYRTKAFNEARARTVYRNLSEEDKTVLIDDYVREEALYREAKKLGFENGDYIIRQRLIQKLDFIAEAGSIPPPPDAIELLEFYNNNRDEFVEPARASFTHIFYTKDDTSYNNALARARITLSALEQADKTLQGGEFGDHFLYQSTYINRTHDQIVDVLGLSAAKLIFAPETSIRQWVGPVTSPHGVHLIFISNRRKQMIEPFDAVQDIAADRMRRAEIAKRKDAYIRQIVANYHIETRLSAPRNAEFTE